MNTNVINARKSITSELIHLTMAKLSSVLTAAAKIMKYLNTIHLGIIHPGVVHQLALAEVRPARQFASGKPISCSGCEKMNVWGSNRFIGVEVVARGIPVLNREVRVGR